MAPGRFCLVSAYLARGSRSRGCQARSPHRVPRRWSSSASTASVPTISIAPRCRRCAGSPAPGVRAAGLIPPFPSKTFPSFTTIATGLWPAHHGIVGNTMDDPAIGRRFALADHDGRSDPRWWLGEPIWVTAERQGRRTAGMFWPGDDVAIDGRRPTTWTRFDDAYPHEARVDRVLEWFARPAGRPAGAGAAVLQPGRYRVARPRPAVARGAGGGRGRRCAGRTAG